MGVCSDISDCLILIASPSRNMGRGGDAKVKKATKADEGSKLISMEEVAQHRVPNDAWVHMKGKVYDVSEWNDHPGK